ncbi:hypothetical protein DVH24_027412 [Malus domestica]|uniref:Uncharacterized protein n=1 Tax=Malus domestica TaxID=3750 RepID=A0A498HBR6_MALDO|nr:hypothetical protein DVH24_027412 [Malus domestica]
MLREYEFVAWPETHCFPYDEIDGEVPEIGVQEPKPGCSFPQRKFIIAKKKSNKENPNVSCKWKDKGNLKMCLCVAYENLRVSQEELFKKRTDDVESEKSSN